MQRVLGRDWGRPSAEHVWNELKLPARVANGAIGSRLIDNYREAALIVTGRLHGLIAGALLLVIILILVLKYIAAGRFLYAVGSDTEAARLAGIRPQLVTFGVFSFTGVLVGLATLGMQTYFYQRLGGITGDVLGATNELNEALVLLLATVVY